MADQKDIEFTYDEMDKLWRMSLGEQADITAAFYNGDYSKSLEQAQHDKHEWILKGINFKPGDRVLDIGCGWGPMLKAIKDKGGEGVGLTLSPAQLKVCKENGLDARLQNWKKVDLKDMGKFDAVVSVGAFEAFCTVEEYLAGKRDQIYDAFFKLCSQVLKDNGRLFLQTMTVGARLPWGERDPNSDEVKRFMDLKAPRRSDERVMATVSAFFPGSWIPPALKKLSEIASPYFNFIEANDGRLDYVQTLTEWEKSLDAPQPGKALLLAKAGFKSLYAGKEYRARLECIKYNNIREVFIRDLFGHQRMFFQKISS